MMKMLVRKCKNVKNSALIEIDELINELKFMHMQNESKKKK